MARIGRSFPVPFAVPRPLAAFGGITLFYLPSTGAAAVSPAFDAAYEDTSIAARLKTVTTKISSAMTTVSFSDISTANNDILFRQWVSDPLEAQTIDAQTLSIQIRASETSTTNNMFLSWGVRLVSNDGDTVRATLVAVQRDGTEADTTLTNRGDTAAISSQSVTTGDRLVFEVGLGGTPIAMHDSSLRIGDADATDLPLDDTTTADNNPWILFQQTLAFQSVVADFVLQSSSSSWPNRGQFGPLLVH